MSEIASVSNSSISSKSSGKHASSLSLDRAAFLLIRIKRVFQKKKQKSNVTEKLQPIVKKVKPPMLRARTLPAIITPSLNIIQAQFDTNNDHEYEPSLDEQKYIQEPQYKYNLSVGDSESSRDGSKSPAFSPRHSVSSTSSTGSASKDMINKKSVSFAKLTRLLSTQSKDKSTNLKPIGSQMSDTITDVSCFSWNNRGMNEKVKKSGSVDSLIDAQQNNKNSINITMDPDFSANRPNNIVIKCERVISSGFSSGFKGHPPISSTSSVQLPEAQRNLQDMIPSSPSIPYRLTRTLPGRRQASIDVFVPEGVLMTKSEKKKLEKLNKFNFDLQAMFSAVENEQLERARMVIESTDVDINSCNTDGFSPLDIAVMTLNIPLIKLLQSYGSKESPKFQTKESRETQLNSLLKEAERCVLDLNLCVFGVSTNGGLSAALLKEKERQLGLWERRLKLLQRIKLGFNQLEPPEPPTCVQLEVVGVCCLRIRFSGPVRVDDKQNIVTKYRVEWSRDNFISIEGKIDITDLQKLEVIIECLESGQNYFVRVASGNCKGFSTYSYPSPNCAIPSIIKRVFYSSWRDVDDKVSPTNEKLIRLDELFQQIIDSRPVNSAEVRVLSVESETPYQQRRGQVRKSIKNLFGSAPKFQKAMKRGIYLACLLYNEDRILVTTDEMLPIIEIDDIYPSSLQNDFYWMLKISCTWEDVKALRRELEKSQSSSVAHFRSKILQAVEQMQTSLGMQDLGKLFYKPLKDPEGTIVLCSIKNLINVKALNCLSVRWLPITKLQKKLSNVNSTDMSETPICSVLIGDLLLSSLQEMISYHKACNNPLPRGLYIGFVKLKSSVEMMSVVVPQNSPNVVPHIRVRENPHISKEEWTCLKSCVQPNQINIDPNKANLKFLQLITKSAHILLNSMEISENDIYGHRVYDLEVIELSSDVSFILLLPPVENVCSIFGQSDELTQCLDLIYLPLRIFEMIHMNTYQQTFISRYSRISAILEMDILVAQQAQREAFSSTEVAFAKSRLNQLQEYQLILDDFWRAMRWIMDVVTFARDKQSIYGISLDNINDSLSSNNALLEDEESTLQIPIINLCSPSVNSPNSPPPIIHPTSRRPSRDDSTIETNLFSNQLRINKSSYSLIDSLHFMSTDYSSGAFCQKSSSDDMRRCVSASKLINGSLRRSCNPIEDNEPNQWNNHLHNLSDSCIINSQINTNIDLSKFSNYDESNIYDNNESKINEKFSSIVTLNSFRPIVLSKDSITECLDSSDERSHSILRFNKTYSFNSETQSNNYYKSPNSSDPFSLSQSNKFCDTIFNRNRVIRVYAAYDCGLPFGTSVKLQVTFETTVKEIIELVVKHLNSSLVLKEENTPTYDLNDLNKFCIIAVYSSNVKHLNNDFKILNLQTPWNRAKLCIKFKDE